MSEMRKCKWKLWSILRTKHDNSYTMLYLTPVDFIVIVIFFKTIAPLLLLGCEHFLFLTPLSTWWLIWNTLNVHLRIHMKYTEWNWHAKPGPLTGTGKPRYAKMPFSYKKPDWNIGAMKYKFVKRLFFVKDMGSGMVLIFITLFLHVKCSREFNHIHLSCVYSQ